MKARILWFEDNSFDAQDFETEFRDLEDAQEVEFCRVPGSSYRANSLAAGICYLLQAKQGEAAFPNLILLDYQLSEDPVINDDPIPTSKTTTEYLDQLIKKMSEKEKNGDLITAVNKCLKDLNYEEAGAEVLRLVSKHFSKVPILLLTGFPEKDLKTLPDVLKECPGLLSGYYLKKKPVAGLIKLIYEILDHPKRGFSLDEIRKRLPEGEADYLLGEKEDGYNWSDTYRRALSDLVLAGEESAEIYAQKTEKGNKRKKGRIISGISSRG